MTSDEIYELTELMKQYHPYDDTLDSESCSDEDYVRGYEDGYSRGWTTVMFALRTELRDSKYTVKQKRSKVKQLQTAQTSVTTVAMTDARQITTS